MKTLLRWKFCDRFKSTQDGYWVECTTEETKNHLVLLLDSRNLDRLNEMKGEYLSTSFATVNPKLKLTPDSYYFLVSKDGEEVIPTESNYPSSWQWNTYCLLEEIEPFVFKSFKDAKEMT